MRPPAPKTISKLIKNTLARLLILALVWLYGNRVYTERRGCPRCGSLKSIVHGKSRRIFCFIIKDSNFEPIYVWLARYKCKRCGKTYHAKGPFYPRINYGAPIVDMALYFAATNPFNKVEKIFLELGIQVDRDTVKRWVKKYKNRAMMNAGSEKGMSYSSINLLKLLYDAENMKKLEFAPKVPLSGSADETYASIKGAKTRLRKENRKRRRAGLKPIKYPECVTVGATYVQQLKSFASIVFSRFPFNEKMAEDLLLPLYGILLLLTDGHKAYKPIEGAYHLRCLFHRLKNICKRDRFLKALEKSGADENEILSYIKQLYEQLKLSTLEQLSLVIPTFFDANNNFSGPLTTNSQEGGNFRLKWLVRVPYLDLDAYFGRIILAAISDSLSTFSGGKPIIRPGALISSFQFGDVMSDETPFESTRERIIRHYDGEKGGWFEEVLPEKEYVLRMRRW